MSLTQEILSQIPGDILGNLRRTDSILTSLRTEENSIPQVVTENPENLQKIDSDVIICGGTLGIIIGCALAVRGLKVTVLERGILQGREQEWNISRHELQVFRKLNLLTETELETAIVTEYNPARVSFAAGTEIWINDVLNIGINPLYLLATLKNRFLAAGGTLLERTPFNNVVIHSNGIKVNNEFTAKLLLDAMGHLSPITKQARQGKKPDALCLVVGSCASGFPKNDSGDLLLSFTPLQNQCQYFWEAFPAKDGRTTYLFTYVDAEPNRLTLEHLFEEYLRLLPEYQNVELQQLKFHRALFGFFPSYRQSPLQTPWNFILPVGDSSGNQSPLSFGGFGSMVRHLSRLTLGIEAAIKTDQLSSCALGLLQPYQPSLSVTWLFQKAMSVAVNQKIDPQQINLLLSAVFQEMQSLGTPVLKPFLQDVVQFIPLTQTLLKTGLSHPLLVAKIIPQVGLLSLFNWVLHYVNLLVYTVLFAMTFVVERFINYLPEKQKPKILYYWYRWVDAWKFGSGSDY
ncbi:FAD-binding oxidoreductase [Anabaena sp. FACHB-1237]|uniref:NAD(P)/FAD-dependent oxidoreductase n=1 Tax=Anabaena sp. FACHB-1237 TaxID=2692769 RepID=UPI0016801115|nr:FAD-dependent oxidoreductase [Anabaena sp. FACHB-1237]MBD2137668.1 FAD-binding oxidoreductase [Anabaena sp. FACHB-1237]